jgi:hypothetical protein
MKTFLSRIFVGAVLWCGVCYADPSSPSSAPPHAVNPPRGTSDAVAATKGVLPENKADSLRNSTTPKPSAVQPAGLVLRNAHNRAPAAAVIGGPAKNKTAGVINGTGMNHKPL